MRSASAGSRTPRAASVQQIDDTGDRVEVTYDAGGPKTVSADICLVAVGRGPVTDGLGLEEAGVSVHEKGFVNVDGQLRTNVDHVWAVGDVAATPLAAGARLVHRGIRGRGAHRRHRGARDRLRQHPPRHVLARRRSPPSDSPRRRPSSADTRSSTEKLDFRAIGKANIVGEGGFVKVVAEADGGPVLGVHMIGPHVTDLISEAMLITNWEAVPDEVAALIHPHPTLSEAVGEAHLALAGKPLHSP